MSSNNMTDGSESESSLRRDKRARFDFDDGNIAATSHSIGTKFPAMVMQFPQVTPFEAGSAVYSRYIETLQPDLQPLLLEHAYAVYQAFSTYFRAKEKYEKEKNDTSFIPKTCNISITLQPRKQVAKSEGFNELTRETETIVNQCRQLLKIQYMKGVEMNVLDLKDDIAKAYAKALPAIAKVFMAQEDVEGESPHKIIADLLRFDRVRALSFLKVTDESFAATYCTINGLASFPTAREPPLFARGVAAANPTAVTPLPLRGGSPHFAETEKDEGGGIPPAVPTQGETPAPPQQQEQTAGAPADEAARNLSGQLEGIATGGIGNLKGPPIPRFEYTEVGGTQQSV